MKLYYAIIIGSLIGLCYSYGQGQQRPRERHGQEGQFNNDVPIVHLQPTIPHYSGSESPQGFGQHNIKSNMNNFSPFQTQGQRPQFSQGEIYPQNQGKGPQFGFDQQNSRDFNNAYGQGHNPEHHQQDLDVRRNNPSFNQQNAERYRPGFQQNFGSPSRHDQYNSREYGQNFGQHAHSQQGFDRRHDSHQQRPQPQRQHSHYY